MNAEGCQVELRSISELGEGMHAGWRSGPVKLCPEPGAYRIAASCARCKTLAGLTVCIRHSAVFRSTGATCGCGGMFQVDAIKTAAAVTT